MLHVPRILFPTDGSECAERARRYAFDLADRFEAEVHVIHVEERSPELSEVIDIREADLLAELHLPAPETSVAVPRLQERRVLHPSAAEGILSYAAEHDTPLIVLGTHGRSGLQRLVLGSVAETVVRRAPGPVLTVGRGGEGAASMTEGHLLVPVDFSSSQSMLLAHAQALAQAYDMTLTLLHVVNDENPPDAYAPADAGRTTEDLRGRAQAALDAAAASLPDDGLERTTAVRTGAPADAICEAADDLDADVLAVATHGRSGLERLLLGSVAETVIRQAPCPVFTVKSFGPSLASNTS